MKIRRIIVVIAMIVGLTVALGSSNSSASAADGCSAATTGTIFAQVVYARCTGGYVGYIGQYRAKGTCNIMFGSYSIYGPWTQIRPGTESQSGYCIGNITHPTYERR